MPQATFLAIGTRGDVEPMVLLAERLSASGLATQLVGVAEYAHLARRAGLTYHSLGPAPLDGFRNSLAGRLATLTPAAQPMVLRQWLAGLAGPIAAVLPAVVEPGSLVVAGVPGRDVALALTEDRGCRMATLLHTAVLPTARPASHLEGRWFWRLPPLDRGFGTWYWRQMSGLSGTTSRQLRRRLGLAVGSAQKRTAATDDWPILLAADPVLVPPAPDWPQTCQQTAAVLAGTPSQWRPPAHLEAFLDGPRPIVYVGLGSLNDTGGDQWQRLVAEAAVRAGVRVVTPVPPGQRAAVGADGVCWVADTPHAWLFERLDAVVHLGGAGTTAAGLQAGVPSAALPGLFDQHYHARRLHQLGVGPAPVPLARVTAVRLAGLLRELTGGGYVGRAAAVGESVRALDGVELTAAILAGMR